MWFFFFEASSQRRVSKSPQRSDESVCQSFDPQVAMRLEDAIRNRRPSVLCHFKDADLDQIEVVAYSVTYKVNNYYHVILKTDSLYGVRHEGLHRYSYCTVEIYGGDKQPFFGGPQPLGNMMDEDWIFKALLSWKSVDAIAAFRNRRAN